MKSLRLIIFVAAAMMLAVACTSEVDDKFDQPASQRIEAGVAETRQLLESAQDGWMMYYYGNTDYGGYNVYCKFKDSQAMVQSEFFGSASETSHYSVVQSAGVLLSFDGYNEIFHFFSDPSLEKYGSIADNFGINGKAFGGDLEFRVLAATADSVVLEGKKHQSKVVMVPVQPSFDWDSYLEKINGIEESMFSANYVLTNGTDTVLTVQPSGRVLVGTDKMGNAHEMPYVVTENGFRLYKAFTVDGVTLTGFQYADGDSYADFSGNGATLSMVIPPINEQFAAGAWDVSFSSLGTLGQAYWTKGKTYSDAAGEEMYKAVIGNYMFSSTYGRNFGLTFASAAGPSAYYGTLGMRYELSGDDEITLSYASDLNVLNGNYYMTYLGYAYIVYPFCYTGVTRTFKLSTDNVKNPSYVVMTDVDDARNVIKVTKVVGQPQSWPFDH